ncbi:GNAT family N-acetyltransferase [Kitasatospora sp. NPDC059571]|uniref:GNAT family N-acetyltransferase n=1 Tax=Kitasatospora sp. NPDC059571 TaxID=3346871 RepID=UPI0036D0F604
MTWTTTSDPDAFRDAAADFLTADPAANTVLLTLFDRIGKDGPHVYGAADPLFGWWRRGPSGPVEGAFVQTPPFPPRLGRMPAEAAGALAGALHDRGFEVTGVGGARAEAEEFAAAWTAAAGTPPARVVVEERLHRLGEPVPPEREPSGRARPADRNDRALLVDWYGAFLAEIAEHRPADVAALVDSRLADGGLYLWEDGGRPVSLAGVSPVIAGMSRVGPVYTPPRLRGRGYASGLVAAVSAHAPALGAREVLLYTDVANPTSNSIYRKLGYLPVADHVVLEF